MMETEEIGNKRDVIGRRINDEISLYWPLQLRMRDKLKVAAMVLRSSHAGIPTQ